MSGLGSPTPEIGGDPAAPHSIPTGMRMRCGAGQWEKHGFVPTVMCKTRGENP